MESGRPPWAFNKLALSSLPFVTAELNYLAPIAGKPRTYAFDPPPGEPKIDGVARAAQRSDLRCAPDRERPLARPRRLCAGEAPDHREEFLRRQGSAGVYYPAVEAFLKATLKADRVVIFDHTVRKRVEGAADVRGAGPRQPATRVHVDQTDLSGANRVREHLPDEADELLKGRVQVINLWRPIRGPLRDAPLAMLDGTTVEPGDLVASDLIYPNRSGETYSVKYNPNHRWFYFPEMTAGRGGALEMLRFRNRRPYAVRAAHRVHRSDHAGRRRPA